MNSTSTKWNWFMSADMDGQWVVTQGKANLDFHYNGIVGELVFEDSLGETISVYAKLNGRYVADSQVVMTLTHDDTPSFSLSGDIYELQLEGSDAYTIILTDGATVLGLARRIETD